MPINSASTTVVITVTALSGRQLEDRCYRLAVRPEQGREWSEYRGTDWIEPMANGAGTLTIEDENKVSRLLIFDTNSRKVYEHGTYDRQQEIGPTYLDKEDDQNTEIITEIWFPDDTGTDQQYPLEHFESHIHLRPQRTKNVGDANYGTAGQRSNQRVDLFVFLGGELNLYAASDEDIPDGGKAIFKGYKPQDKRQLIMVRTQTSEYRVSGIDNYYLERREAISVAQRTTDNTEWEVSLVNLAFHWSRELIGGKHIDRVTGVEISGTYTRLTGPDGLNSAFHTATTKTVPHAAVAGNYTVIGWVKTGDPGFGGLAMTAFGDASSGWQMYYATGAGLAASLLTILGNTNFFDIRVVEETLDTRALTAYRHDVVNNVGRAYLPEI